MTKRGKPSGDLGRCCIGYLGLAAGLFQRQRLFASTAHSFLFIRAQNDSRTLFINLDCNGESEPGILDLGRIGQTNRCIFAASFTAGMASYLSRALCSGWRREHASNRKLSGRAVEEDAIVVAWSGGLFFSSLGSKSNKRSAAA
jgi:hypothetical protein